MKTIKNTGFSAIELLLVLSLIGLLVYFGMSISNPIFKQTVAQNVAEEANEYSQTIIRYISTHQSILQETLFTNGIQNGHKVTVTPTILKSEGFINKGYPEFNRLRQFPCAVIFGGHNHQLQAFLYYRANNNVVTLDSPSLNSGLQHIGAISGLYRNGTVFGAAKDWSFNNEFVKNMFVNKGSIAINSANNLCSGSHTANNSYVLNITSKLTIASRLPKDDNLHQYSDILHKVGDLDSNNMMNNDLNMEYQVPGGDKRLSNIIFQMNNNCVMDPRRLATMQDYDPRIDGRLRENEMKPNNLGCKNRQLAIQAKRDNGSQVMLVSGFNSSQIDPSTYVGEISASSVQPTQSVTIGTPCSEKELGKMARQQLSNDINSLYVSQVQCMINWLCPSGTNNMCYMPINSVTIDMPGFLSSSPDNEPHRANKWSCPSNLYLDATNIKIGGVPNPSTHPRSWCFWHRRTTPEVRCVGWYPNIGACSHFIIRTVWEEKGGGFWCDRSRDVYGGSFRAHCSNDASKIPITIMQ